MRGASARIKCRSWEGSNSHCEEWEASGLTTRPRGLDVKKNYFRRTWRSKSPAGRRGSTRLRREPRCPIKKPIKYYLKVTLRVQSASRAAVLGENSILDRDWLARPRNEPPYPAVRGHVAEAAAAGAALKGEHGRARHRRLRLK